MKRFILPLVAMHVCVLAGCSSTSTSRSVDADWSMPKHDFGRMVVLRELRGVVPADTVERKTVEVREVTDIALGALPGTQVVDETAFQEALGAAKPWSAVSDYEAVQAGRKAGIDTVCLMTVESYGGFLSIGLLPLPGFGTWTHADYRLRMIDVNTGRLIVDTSRRRATGGWLCIRKPSDARDDLTADLADLLAVE